MYPFLPDDTFAPDWTLPSASTFSESRFSDRFSSLSLPDSLDSRPDLFGAPEIPDPFDLLSFDFPSSARTHHRAPSTPAHPPPPVYLPPAPFQPSFPPKDLHPSSVQPGHTRQSSLPAAPPRLDSDAEFLQICRDPKIKFNPKRLGFIPRTFWLNQELTFGDLVTDFFQKKNNSNSRFSHKLFNALKIATLDPFYVEFLGVEWISENVLKINKQIFARLLAIQTVDGSLFHRQGNFPSHGFVELSEAEARMRVKPSDLEGVDYEVVRLLTHQPGIFTRDCTEDDIARCKWVSPRNRG
jgi:hypothetical protein